MRFVFDSFTLDTNVFELRCGGMLRPLQPKPLDLLRYLIENRDRVVLKRELLSQLWADVRVTENALAQAVACVREALADAKAPAIVGMRGRGYRFVLHVEELADDRPSTERGNTGFVAEPGRALDLDVARRAKDAHGVRTICAPARASGPLSSFRALLAAHAAAFPEDSVRGLPVGVALAEAETESALGDLITDFITDDARPPTVMILEDLERADLASLLLFCQIVAWPCGAVTMLGTCDFGSLRPDGVVARALYPHAGPDRDGARSSRVSESVPTSRTGVRLSAVPREALTSALGR